MRGVKPTPLFFIPLPFEAAAAAAAVLLKSRWEYMAKKNLVVYYDAFNFLPFCDQEEPFQPLLEKHLLSHF